MNVSPAGRAFIERKEGCRLTAYRPMAGTDVWTIGYGCTGPSVVPGLVITQAEADRMLSDRLAAEFEPGVMAAIEGAPTTQGQFDAMVSLAWNIGVHAFAHSEVAGFHRDGDYDAAADAFLHWDHYHGAENAALALRRQEEGQTYMDASP